MAAVSPPPLPPSHPAPTSSPPSHRSLKQVLSGRRRSSEIPGDGGQRSSIDSITLERSPTRQSTQSSPSRDGSSKSGSSGLRKLVPGHEKRQRRRKRDEELKAVAESEVRGRDPNIAPVPPPAANRSNSSLLTDYSDYDTAPPLISRDSHVGYLTSSSPLMKVVTDGHARAESDATIPSKPPMESFPSIIEPPEALNHDLPAAATPKLESIPALPNPGLIDKADTLRIDEARHRKSFSSLRGRSPGKKIREAISGIGKSPRSSPERPAGRTHDWTGYSLTDQPATIADRRLVDNVHKQAPAPLTADHATISTSNSTQKPPSQLVTDIAPPRTPPSGSLVTPVTTVTPPTPTEKARNITSTNDQDSKGSDSELSNVVVSESGNMISHRRIRSTSSVNHGKSKLSSSMTAPLTPLEETKSPTEKSAATRNFTPGGSFFSSWVSAAQNAATSLTNFSGQNRSRSGTASSEPVQTAPAEESSKAEDSFTQSGVATKKLAIETLGSGDLDFSHLGLESASEAQSASASRSDLTNSRHTTDLKRYEVQAKVEDIMAKRAVSAAYEGPGDATPVAEIQDPIANLKHMQTFDSNTAGTLTPSNGSLFDGDTGNVKRSNSVRSKLANRRSRGSSIVTGQSTIGAIVGASTTTLVNPATLSKTTSFTPAPKARNRGYHQQFRSVPEDDNLIEDYSCALQKEILLAGRIYISEGHICFSSNILGWVTTLIISFEEIVSIERENTAMIIPNAIAIQTLHARHTFRSLLSREATFDLIIGIWKVNHPASFQKSVNGKKWLEEQARLTVENSLAPNEESAQASDASSADDDDDSDESDGDGDSAHSVVGSNPSVAGSEFIDAKTIPRKPSGSNGALIASTGAAGAPATDVITAASVVAGVPAVDFPGPVTHAPTDCIDSATHYEIIIKDEVIPAPLGKIYSLLYGPQSGSFVRKYLVDECKCLDLVLEDDKKGLNNDIKSRQYSYIKPLGGSIGPKQTKCITTETLDLFDLEKAVSVTCSTQTPDVPSGSAFSTKTRYCLSWAAGNATRLQMNCTVEWTAKSWLKGPIEKGAKDGQQQYGDGLVKALKGALGRARATTVGSKGAKTKKKKKGDKKTKNDKTDDQAAGKSDWGPLESLRPTLEPVVDIVRPLLHMQFVTAILFLMVFTMWFRGSSNGNTFGSPGSRSSHAGRVTAYEELWQHEESELWKWLEDRAGVGKVLLSPQMAGADPSTTQKQQSRQRKKQLNSKDMTVKLRAEAWSRKELQAAVQMTREKLDLIQQVMEDQSN